ncbi:peptidylprolyl isomerase [Acetobacteraceae bacterium KSS8]|uniref:peptidylprolyl isomerase n=1 Tax=Endosaccharibacter trunci TaxID=2812733 RepID=A0ABT1W4B3_9PROT|nr:peptidylprolyl isomerase [Acetobacteraceae bacterium KSS8]
MHRPSCFLLACAALLTGAAAPAARSPAEIVSAAPDAAWHALDPSRLLLMTLGDGRQVIIELAPDFAPVHVANILKLARAGWWNGAAIVREQDNYVVQWARMPEGQALPSGVAAHPPAEYERDATLPIVPLDFPDPYAPKTGWADGFPVASNGRHVWLAHCYGMVGVGRDMPPDTGSGEELYAVNGQAPRQLDRNIALVGRVVSGMEILSALPRGTAALGFYADPKQRVPIRSVQVVADMPEASRPVVQILPPGGAVFADVLAARVNRRDPFFVRPAGATDLCNVPVPTRRFR